MNYPRPYQKTAKNPTIILLWEDGTQVGIEILSNVMGISRKGKRPSGFWYEPNQPTNGVSREEFMVWLHSEFVYIFDKDSQLFQSHLALLDYKV